MKLYLVRHGETDSNRAGRAQGTSDAPLNARGKSQAEALGSRLGNVLIDAVYSSPLTRAQETAGPIARGHGLELIILEHLRELDVGDLDGLSSEELREQYPGFLEQWMKNVGSLRMPGGESIAELQERTWASVEEIAQRHQDGIVVAVSHNFAIQSILCRALGLELVNFRKIRQDLGAISILDIRKGQPSLITLNDRCHLDGLDYRLFQKPSPPVSASPLPRERGNK